MITRKDLDEFILIEKQIQSLKKQIRYYEKKRQYAVHGSVIGSSKSFPFTERSFCVEGGGYTVGGMSEEKRMEKICGLSDKLKNQLLMYEDKKIQVQEFIVDIDDIEARLLFTYLFIDGMSQSQVGDVLGMEQSSVSKKLTRLLKKYIPKQ